MKKILLIISTILVSVSFIHAQEESDYKLDITGKPHFDSVNGIVQPDTFAIGFNLYQDKGTVNEKRIKNIPDIDQVNFEVEDYKGEDEYAPPEFIPGSFEKMGKEGTESYIPNDITVSLLIDKSGTINSAEMDQIKKSVRSFVEQIPEGCVFFSWFHSDVSSSIPINKDNFDEANFDTTYLHTDLYNAISIKLDEFDEYAINDNTVSEEGYEKNAEIANRNSIRNILIVLTDGDNDIASISKYSNPEYKQITEDDLLEKIEKYKDKVKVYTLGYGEDSKNFNEEALQNMCAASDNPNGYSLAEPDKILKLFEETLVEELAVNFRARFSNPPNKTYLGDERELRVTLIYEPDSIVATGSVTYGLGSKTNPRTTGEKSKLGRKLLMGLLAGAIFLLVVLIIIQLIWPLIRNKIFNIKYLKKYRPAKMEVKKTCPFCFDEIHENDKVIVKCEHVVHKDCWVKCGYMCPEFGQNCNTGKQDYFDITDPFSKRNKSYYLNWVFYGLIGGLLTWLIYMSIKDLFIFNGLSGKLVQWLVPDAGDLKNNFIEKISPLFIIGILMGFFLSIFFAYTEEYRRISFIVFGRIMLRGIIGAAIGFLSFFMGNMLILAFNEPFTNVWIDWIPWLIFGVSIGFSLSVGTTIYWKHGLLGGLISIIFSFLILYAMAGSLGELATVLCFMGYGAGLGVSIATVRSTSEQYFIKILNGVKEGNLIAVHKWMSAQGGLNEVYIGKSNICEVQMNWEKAQEVGDKHAKMYINKARKMPVLVSLTKSNNTLYDGRIDMMVGREYDLINGVTFKIGETLFQYVEKDS